MTDSLWVKVCGVQTESIASRLTNEGLVNAIGLNRYPSSSRYVDDVRAKTLSEVISEQEGEANITGVYVNESIQQITEDIKRFNLDFVQLHGDESPDTVNQLLAHTNVIKAFRISPDFKRNQLEAYQPTYFLLDAYRPDRYGGTGETAPWETIRPWTEAFEIILAGGITPANVVPAIQSVDPYGIDVNSGLEGKDGTKDWSKVQLLIENVKSVLT
ncbi:MAG: hypothetical protein ABEJ65_11510 [bacterium]